MLEKLCANNFFSKTNITSIFCICRSRKTIATVGFVIKKAKSFAAKHVPGYSIWNVSKWKTRPRKTGFAPNVCSSWLPRTWTLDLVLCDFSQSINYACFYGTHWHECVRCLAWNRFRNQWMPTNFQLTKTTFFAPWIWVRWRRISRRNSTDPPRLSWPMSSGSYTIVLFSIVFKTNWLRLQNHWWKSANTKCRKLKIVPTVISMLTQEKIPGFVWPV